MNQHIPSKLVRAACTFAALIAFVACGTVATPAPASPSEKGTSEAPAVSTEAMNAATQAVTETAPEAATLAPTAANTVVATGEASGKTLVIGDVSGKPTASIELLQPIADYLAANLSKYGITAGTVKVAPDFTTIADWLKSGEVDLIFQTPYPAVLLENAVGAKSVLRRWRNGDADYYTVIFARSDSGMKSVEDMKGHMMAVQDEYSTSSYALPLAYLIKSGVKVTKKDTPDVAVEKDEVGYTNSKSDDNTLQWLISGKVALAATDNRSYERIPEETRNQLTIIAQTDKVPRNLLVVRPGMDTALLDAIKAALIDMDKTDAGKALLDKFQKTAKFDEFPDGPDTALAYMRELAKLLK